MNLNRQAAGAVKAGDKIGGQFATHERATAAGPPSSVDAAKEAAKQNELYARMQRRAFDYGTRAYDAQTQRNEYALAAYGHLVQAEVPNAMEFVLTHSADGTGSMDLHQLRDGFGANIELDPQLRDELSQEAQAAHFDGDRFTTETDPETGAELCAISVNYQRELRPEDDIDRPAPDRAMERIDRVMGDWLDDNEPETKLQDALTDLLHYAAKHDLDMREVLHGAEFIWDDEVKNPMG